MKKLIILLIVPLLLTGCWNYRELNQLAIITGIGIDKEDEEYVVTIMIANASSGNSGSGEKKATSTTYEGRGDTIYEAFDDNAEIVSRQLYFGHIEVFILSEEVATDDLEAVTDLIFRYPQVRNEFPLVIAKDVKAGDILKITSPIDSFSSSNIFTNIKTNSSQRGYIYQVSFNQFVKALLQEGKNAVLPTVTIVGNIEEGNKLENTEQSEPDTYLKLESFGLFKDNAFVAFANYEESKGISIINNKVEISSYKINCDDRYIVLEINKIEAKTEINLDEKKPKITIAVNNNASIQELECKRDLSNDKVIEEIISESEKELKKTIEAALNLARSNKTDIFGFGNKIYKQNYKYWYEIKESWDDEIFPNTQIIIDVKTEIEGRGSINKSIEVSR